MNILFVVGNMTLTAGNTVLSNKLIAAGHTVTNRAASNADKTTTGFDAVILASDASSGDLTAYLTQAVPLMVTQHAVTDDAKMWTGGSFMSTNTAATTVTLAGTHEINTLSGLTSPFTAISPAGVTVRYLTDSNMLAGAVILGRWVQISTVAVAAWAIEAGVLLSDGVATAPARRLYMPPLSESAGSATADLLTWWEAGIRWLGGETTPVDPSVESDMYMWNATSGELEPVLFYTQEGGVLV